MPRSLTLLVACALVFLSCAPDAPAPEPQADPTAEEWISLFNGEDLGDWIVKIAGHPLGENYGNTFRVEDGILKVSYDQYDQFDRQFGSLFYKDPFSHYRLRVTYRFVGEQAPGGPAWGLRDSGIQLHSPSPESMTVEQEFPISVEINLIGGVGSGDRPTGNLCTPGTHVMMNGELFTEQCAATSTQTRHGDGWVTIEAEVRGGTSITHILDGEVVAAYELPRLDETSPDAQRLLAAGADTMLHGGYISLQSNSHPIEFRAIEILPLDPNEADAMHEAGAWTPLFNGRDLSGWDTYLGPEETDGERGAPIGLNTDPQGVFQVVEIDGQPALRISGEVGGGLSTVDEYEDYHLTLSFKWGETMWWPSKDKKDSGLLYHAVGPHGADYGFWMRSQEFQIQEGDCGDYWGVAGGVFDVPAIRNEHGDYVFDRAGERLTFRENSDAGRHCIKHPDAEKPTGEWNTLDLYVRADTSVHVVNGMVNMILYNSRQTEGGEEIPLTKGKIQLQSEGAEIFYRDLRIRPIDRIPPHRLD